MIFGSESGCLGLDNQACGMGGIARISFRRGWIANDSIVHFSMSNILGTIFHDFWSPGDWLEI